MCLTVWEILGSAKNFIKDHWHGNKTHAGGLAGNIQMPHRPRLMWSNLHPLSARLTQSRRLKRTMVFNEATAKYQDFPSNNLRRIVLERLLGHKVLKLLREFLLQITMVYCYHDAQRRITTDGGKTQETKRSYLLFPFRQIYAVLPTPIFSCFQMRFLSQVNLKQILRSCDKSARYW